MLTKCDRSLSDIVGKTVVVAYQENTDLLISTMHNEGLKCTILRQVHQPHYKEYSPSYLCLLNHQNAWALAATEKTPTLILEADFVPVKGFGQLSPPFDINNSHFGIAWLYTCAPQLYSVSSQGFAEGFSTSLVAYVISPQAAQQLLELVDHVTEDPGPTQYSSWDSSIEEFLRKRKFQNYLPFRNYGEHGGKPNLEHQQYGLSAVHRADILYGSLAFIPQYAESQKHPRLVLLAARFKARLKGIARLFAQKYLRQKIVLNSSTPGRLVKFSISRHLTLTL